MNSRGEGGSGSQAGLADEQDDGWPKVGVDEWESRSYAGRADEWDDEQTDEGADKRILLTPFK